MDEIEYDVFFSSHSPNLDQAKIYVEALRSAGLRVFSYHDRIPAGTPHRDFFIKHVETSTLFVILGSNTIHQSHNVLEEVQTARKFQKKIIPLCAGIDPESLPFELSKIQAINLAQSKEEDVVKAVNRALIDVHRDSNWERLIQGLIAGFVACAVYWAFIKPTLDKQNSLEGDDTLRIT